MEKVIILMGVSGCGKTTIGEKLAIKMGVPFYDGDNFHPESNIDKMKNNSPLNDSDRQPWLENLAANIEKWSKTSGAILACSALKESYRKTLTTRTKNVEWVVLHGSFGTIKNRIQNRASHFMKTDLLQSQFDTLEVPNYGLYVDIEKESETLVNEIFLKLNTNA